MNSRLLWRWGALALVPVSLAAHFLVVNNSPLVDERAHFRQIAQFLAHDFSHDPLMSTLPGYHALIASCMWLTGWTTLGGARTFSFFISIATIGVFHLLARRMTPDIAVARTLQFALLPILFPFLSLVYTDILSLSLVLAMILCDLRGRHVLGGFAGLLACLVRQNMIIWLPFSMLISDARDGSRDSRSGLARYWVHGLTMGLFVVFVSVNGRVAVGSAHLSSARPVHLTNVFFMLFIVAVLFWPAFIARFHVIGGLLRRSQTWAVLACLAGAYWIGFINDHPWNNIPTHYFLRNDVLILVSSSAALKFLFFVPIAAAVVGLWATPLRGRWWWLYPTAALSLFPLWLVEQRYYLVPVSLFVLMREPASAEVESAEIGLFAMMAIAFFVITERGWGFL